MAFHLSIIRWPDAMAAPIRFRPVAPACRLESVAGLEGDRDTSRSLVLLSTYVQALSTDSQIPTACLATPS